MLNSCKSNTKKPIADVAQVVPSAIENTVAQDNLSSYETAYFASGCFWCVEAIFESVNGVKEAVSGYAGGAEENPTYEMIGRGTTSHAEAVAVYYNPDIISFTTLVAVFFDSHDPTTLNRQGPDSGTQYRSIAFYENEREQRIINDYITSAIRSNLFGNKKIYTEVKPFEKFWEAEEYHQDYERKHPNNAYIKQVSIPRLNAFKKNFSKYLKEEKH